MYNDKTGDVAIAGVRAETAAVAVAGNQHVPEEDEEDEKDDDDTEHEDEQPPAAVAVAGNQHVPEEDAEEEYPDQHFQEYRDRRDWQWSESGSAWSKRSRW